MSDLRFFIYGLGLGAAAGILMAPRAGVQTRQLLMDGAREQQDNLTQQAADLRDNISQQAADLRDLANDKVNRTKKAARATAQGIGMAFEVGKEELMG
jgi:gas vesicle protein